MGFAGRNTNFYNNLTEVINDYQPSVLRGSFAVCATCMDKQATNMYADWTYTRGFKEIIFEDPGSAPVLLAASMSSGLPAFYKGLAGQHIGSHITYFPYLNDQEEVDKIIADIEDCEDIAEVCPVHVDGKILQLPQALINLERRGKFKATSNLRKKIALFGKHLSVGVGAQARTVVLIYNEERNELSVAVSSIVAMGNKTCNNVKIVCAAGNLLTTP